MEVDFATVSTSMLTSGGVLFAAYKLWFQKRLEDHKSLLKNSVLLFDMEMGMLIKLAKINQEIQKNSIDIRAELPNEEIFIMRLPENIKSLQVFIDNNSHLLIDTQIKSMNLLISKYKQLQSDSNQFKSPNTSYGGGQYSAYENLSTEINDMSKQQLLSTNTFYTSVRNNILKMAGR